MKRITAWSVSFALVLGSPVLLIGTTDSAAAQPRKGNKNDVAAPTGIAFSYATSTLTITWSPAAGAAKYAVLRRQGTAQEQLGQVSTTAFTGPLPTRGVAYEYQVISIGRIAEAPSAWVPYTVPEIMVLLMPPPPPVTGTITPMVVRAGPASLTGTSTIPGQIHLTWQSVANATGYRLTRSSSVPAAEANLAETGVLVYYYNNAPVDFDVTYSYKVYALFASATGVTVSTPSPVASLQTMPFVQASGLKYGTTFSPTPGRANVSLTWTGAPGIEKVEKFIVWDGTGRVLGYPTSRTFAQPDMAAGPSYTVCVAAIYPYGVDLRHKDAPCIPVTVAAGPTQLTATSSVPGQITLRWDRVPTAPYYRIVRSNAGGPPSPLAISSTIDAFNTYTYVNVYLQATNTFQVHAQWSDGRGEFASASSPVASATPLPFVHPSGLTYTAVPSTTTLGRLNVTLSWNAVNGAERYAIFGNPADATKYFTSSPSYVQRDIPPGATYTVCVGTVYPGDVRQDNTAPCIAVKL